ncbi:hypothetical protein, partial [Bacillus cereus group sp. BC330]|uniref:hypothetical protein n=1 Tax=Bacillus cereus group sp. BC330 TaxID=3445306 RepID=UPI003F28D761
VQICGYAAALNSGWNGASESPRLPICVGLDAHLKAQFDNAVARPACEASNALQYRVFLQAEKLTSSAQEPMNNTAPLLGS